MYLLKSNDSGYGYSYGYGFGYSYGYSYGYRHGFHRDKRRVNYTYPTPHNLTPEHKLFLTATRVAPRPMATTRGATP